MWIKFLLSGLIIAFCILLGYLAANKYRARKKFFAQFEAFNLRYLNELSYARKPLSEFLEGYEYSGDFAKTVSSFSQKREAGCNHSFLTKEEKGECADYFSMLGKGDSSSQSVYFASKKAYLAEKKGTAEKECKARASLYLKLGLLAGLAVVILII